MSEPFFLNQSMPKGYSLRQFPSTIQIIHAVSDCREKVAAEFPKPYEPQTRAWWTFTVLQAIAQYRHETGY